VVILNRKLTTALLGLVMALSLFGCGKESVLGKYSEKGIIPVVEKSLEQKYKESFSISSVNNGDDGVNFSRPYYFGSATCKGNGVSFELRVETDGSGLLDNYEGYLYKSEVEEEIKEIFSSSKGIVQKKLEVEYLLSENTYGSLEQYKKSGNAAVQADVTVKANDAQEAAEVAFGLLDRLQSTGYGYGLDFEWNGDHVILYREGQYEKVTKEQIRRKFGV
jgi:hypothetical protein